MAQVSGLRCSDRSTRRPTHRMSLQLRLQMSLSTACKSRHTSSISEHARVGTAGHQHTAHPSLHPPHAAERSDGDAGQRPRDSATDTAARPSTSVPPAPPEPCRPSLQARIDLLLQQQARSGKQLISTLLHNREYRNPRFMERLVELNNVQQYGTCFAPAVFDPASLPEEDYLPQIRRRLEKQVRRSS